MAKIHVLGGPLSGTEFKLEKDVIYTGDPTANDFKISDQGVSRKRLKIFSVEGCYFIEDLKTKNGTLINGEPLLMRVSRGSSRRTTVFS